MKKKYMALVLTVLWLAAAGTAAFAQPCTPSYPNVVPVGSSHCIQLCPGNFVTFQLEGNLLGPQAVPVLIMSPGCQWAMRCDVACAPITPPTELELGGDPFYPNDWYGETNCLIIYMYHVHDNVWGFEVLSFCQGCFCLTFDRQLSAQLASFTARAGDGSVTLNWTTASESNNDRFVIERNGATAGEVAAANLPTGSAYAWADHDVVNGTAYNYSLISVDLNGGRETIATQSVTPNFSNAVISEYALHQNYPNPFNPTTSIVFDLVQPGAATLSIYNVRGESVATLVNGAMGAGRHTVVFNGANLASGVYLYKLEVNGFSEARKLVLLK